MAPGSRPPRTNSWPRRCRRRPAPHAVAAPQPKAPAALPTSPNLASRASREERARPPPDHPSTTTMAWGSGPNTSPLNGTISLEGIPNLPGYRSTPMRPQKHRQTLQIRHGSMVVIGHRDPLPGSPGSTVRLDRSISRGSDARTARSPLVTLTGRYSLIEQQKDALAAEQGQGRKMPFPKGQPLPKWLRHGKEQLTFKARSRRPTSAPSLPCDSCPSHDAMRWFLFGF